MAASHSQYRTSHQARDWTERFQALDRILKSEFTAIPQPPVCSENHPCAVYYGQQGIHQGYTMIPAQITRKPKPMHILNHFRCKHYAAVLAPLSSRPFSPMPHSKCWVDRVHCSQLGPGPMPLISELLINSTDKGVSWRRGCYIFPSTFYALPQNVYFQL